MRLTPWLAPIILDRVFRPDPGKGRQNDASGRSTKASDSHNNFIRNTSTNWGNNINVRDRLRPFYRYRVASGNTK